jgi:hypothetical protein
MSIETMIEKIIIAPKKFQLLPKLFWAMLEKYSCQFSVAFSCHPRWTKIFGCFWLPDWVIKIWLPNFLNNAQNVFNHPPKVLAI